MHLSICSLFEKEKRLKNNGEKPKRREKLCTAHDYQQMSVLAWLGSSSLTTYQPCGAGTFPG